MLFKSTKVDKNRFETDILPESFTKIKHFY